MQLVTTATTVDDFGRRTGSEPLPGTRGNTANIAERVSQFQSECLRVQNWNSSIVDEV